MSSSTTTDSSSITPSNLSVTAAVPNRTDDEDDESEALYIRQKTNKTLKILLIEMERVLHCMEHSEKRAYETAQEIVPNLVATEIPLRGFLCTEDYDPDKAARRCALYWKYRREVFGDKRWLLPMTQTGTGALTEPDINFLRTGWIQAYPAGDDEFLVLADMSKLTNMARYAEENGLDLNVMYDRCIMYISTMVGQEAAAKIQRTGVTTIHIVNSNPRPPVHLRRQEWDIGLRAVPFQVKRTLVVQEYEFGKDELLNFLRLRTASAIAYNCNGGQQQRRAVDEVHGNSVCNLMQGLSLRGIPRAYLPVALGGYVHLDDRFANWTRARLSLEEFMCSPLSSMIRSTNVLPENVHHSSTQVGSLMMIPATKKPKGKRLIRRNNETEDLFCKKRNALYSRRLYHKRKLGVLSLEEEIKKIEASNERLKVEHQRLQALLEQAQIVLNLHLYGWNF